MADYDRNKSVVTVGPRATLPSIYVENETAGNFGPNSLRYRNRIADEEINNNNDIIKGGKMDSFDDRSLGSSIRSTPSYGTPGTSASFASPEEDFTLKSPDSGFKTPRTSKQMMSKMRGENPYGSFIDSSPMQSVAATKGVDVAEPQTVSHEEKIKAKLEELHRRWRHHQRRAALFGTTETISDIWESVTDFDVIKELMPIIVTLIIVASCFVTICLLSTGLIRNPTGMKLPENLNGKYLSIEYGRSKLNDRLARVNRLPPKELKDEFGNVLGGKKASIQFAFNMRQQAEGTAEPITDADITKPEVKVEPAPEEDAKESEDVLEELSFKVASKVVNLYDQLSREKGGNVKDASEREELLKKLRTFGNFATTKMDPAEPVSEEAEHDPEEAKIVDPKEEKPELPQEPKAEAAVKPIKVEPKVQSKPKVTKAAEPQKTIAQPTTPRPPPKSKRSPNDDPFKKFLKPETSQAGKTEPTKAGKAEPAMAGKAEPVKAKSGKAADGEDDPFKFRNKQK